MRNEYIPTQMLYILIKYFIRNPIIEINIKNKVNVHIETSNEMH